MCALWKKEWGQYRSTSQMYQRAKRCFLIALPAVSASNDTAFVGLSGALHIGEAMLGSARHRSYAVAWGRIEAVALTLLGPQGDVLLTQDALFLPDRFLCPLR